MSNNIDIIDWVLQQFKHMGASERELQLEAIAMLLDHSRISYNLEYFDTYPCF